FEDACRTCCDNYYSEGALTSPTLHFLRPCMQTCSDVPLRTQNRRRLTGCNRKPAIPTPYFMSSNRTLPLLWPRSRTRCATREIAIDPSGSNAALVYSERAAPLLVLERWEKNMVRYCLVIAAAAIGYPEIGAAAERAMPNFDISVACSGSGAVETVAKCTQDEQAARDQLTKL